MSKKILYIEDEEAIGGVYKNLLNNAGFQTEWVLSVPAAEKLAETFQPDLLLVDNGLKEGKQGIEAIPDLKKSFPQAKIVIFSNHSEDDKVKKAKKLGATDFWYKIKISPDILVKDVTELLSV